MTDPTPIRFTAAEVPGLRRELAEWYGGPQGLQYYYNSQVFAQAIGMRTQGPPTRVAQARSAGEVNRLKGDLWYVDDELCSLLAEAHPKMPPFAPRPSDLPSQSGFVVFARPFATYTAAGAYDDGVFDGVVNMVKVRDEDKVREFAERVYHQRTHVVAVSWGPIPDGAPASRWPSTRPGSGASSMTPKSPSVSGPLGRHWVSSMER